MLLGQDLGIVGITIIAVIKYKQIPNLPTNSRTFS